MRALCGGFSVPEVIERSFRRATLSAASVAAVVVLAANNAVGASDKQTLDPAQNTSGNGPDVLAQNATPKEAKSSTRAKVNVDSQGVILKGYDVVAYFKQGKPAKGNPAIESAYQGATVNWVLARRPLTTGSVWFSQG
jgi:hypothetical protein